MFYLFFRMIFHRRNNVSPQKVFLFPFLFHEFDEVVDLPVVAHHLNDDGVLGVVHHLALVGVGGGADVPPGGGVVSHLDEQQLPAHGLQGVQLPDGADVRQLVELVDELLLLDLVALGLDGNAGVGVGLRLADRKGADVELPPPEHAGHPVEDAELVVDQHR